VVLSGPARVHLLVSKDHCADRTTGSNRFGRDGSLMSCSKKGCSPELLVIGMWATDNNTLGIPLNARLLSTFGSPVITRSTPPLLGVAVQRAGAWRLALMT